MIEPIRPVRLGIPSAGQVLFDARFHLWLTAGHCRRLALGAQEWLCAPRRRSFAPMPSAYILALPLARKLGRSESQPAQFLWQPWSAHPAFADELLRWWPSAEFPPLEPAVVIEDRRPDRPPEPILWPAHGELVDIWV